MATGLTLRRFGDVNDFEALALPFLVEREAEHNLFLGICANIRAGRYSDPYLAVVERGDAVVAAAFRTPPHQLGLSRIEDAAALDVLAEDVRAAFDSLPGVVGAKSDARAFARRWSELTGASFTVAMEQRIYEATESHVPAGVDGELREATPADRDLLIAWVGAFHDEVGGILTSAEDLVDFRLSDDTGGLVVWWDGPAVSMAGFGGPTPNGIRVGPVYTPPELRGRGYASACTAALTKRLLDEARRFVFLFTDLANPTSNSIYQKIGYRPVCDVDQYRFT
jgi:hypothetical protein